ncbi:efflux transporter outer membrane subunit [Phenylobacterium montanum]|uniref:Efflux transporter outer membrane subunit n=1 Tax=Phenylobacterium montanum TaxID=2823693 RepID=A0A975FYT3_9CAUL|nr:efflux transporter outer membrane subunit [Caulobacter sp. S6]QUD87353.1 efflux transporter outer membrane subunit [Caulobacter sp. S6]
MRRFSVFSISLGPLLSVVALGPLLGACALGPKVMTPDTRLPAAYEAPAAATGGEARIEAWWGLYDDPQLQSLVEEALKRAPDAESAEARLREALAVRSQALMSFNPQGALQASGTRTDTRLVSGRDSFSLGPGQPQISLITTGPTDTYAAQFNVSWELDLFGRRRTTRHKAEADLAAARFDYAATRTSLAANVADQLFQARGLAIQLDDAREAARIQRELLDVAQKKAAHGLGSQADADQVASQTAQTDAQVADLETQLHAARRTLLVLVGRGADPLESLPTPATAGTAPPVPASVPGALLADRPDVREAAEKLKSAAGTLKLDELALFPKFPLQPGATLNSNVEFGSALTTSAWSIGAGLAQPILDLPRLKAEIRAQGARADQAAIAYGKTVQTAYGEAENALTGLASDEARVKLLTAGEAQGRSALDASRRRYAAGIDDLSTVLTAERTWRSARSALTGAQVQALRRSVQAFKALGGGWSPPAATTTRAAR